MFHSTTRLHDDSHFHTERWFRSHHGKFDATIHHCEAASSTHTATNGSTSAQGFRLDLSTTPKRSPQRVRNSIIFPIHMVVTPHRFFRFDAMPNLTAPFTLPTKSERRSGALPAMSVRCRSLRHTRASPPTLRLVSQGDRSRQTRTHFHLTSARESNTPLLLSSAHTTEIREGCEWRRR